MSAENNALRAHGIGPLRKDSDANDYPLDGVMAAALSYHARGDGGRLHAPVSDPARYAYPGEHDDALLECVNEGLHCVPGDEVCSTDARNLDHGPTCCTCGANLA